MKISAMACAEASGLALSRLPISMAQVCSVGSLFCLLRQIRKAVMVVKMARIRNFIEHSWLGYLEVSVRGEI